MKHRYLIGIDEAGRGPLAGPVAVGAVLVPVDFDWAQVSGARDSKQMTEGAREFIFESMETAQSAGALRFAVALSTPRTIDSRGIVPAIREALARAVGSLSVSPQECKVLLDGGLRAPDEFLHQETIIRGDATEPVISLASIAAKVTRDRHMVRLAAMYPQYSFELHKGYGTKRHRDAIQKNGLCEIHRATFCKALTNQGNKGY